jgi:hypothetical protein
MSVPAMLYVFLGPHDADECFACQLNHTLIFGVRTTAAAGSDTD